MMTVEVCKTVKFPRTQHLMDLGVVSRDDLLLAECDRKAFFYPKPGHVLTLEEKVDGANLGISIDESFQFLIQNRGKYVNSKFHTHFKSLDKWLMDNSADLFKILLQDGIASPRSFILFGEWLAAKYSIHYTSLPERFLAFDVLDCKSMRFLSRQKFDALLIETKINKVPRIAEYSLPLSESSVRSIVKSKSSFSNGPIEGIYFRLDEGDWLFHRSKVVRSDFITGNEFWAKGMITWNSFSTT